MTIVTMKNEHPLRFQCSSYNEGNGRPCSHRTPNRCPRCGGTCCGIHAKYADGRQICQWCAKERKP